MYVQEEERIKGSRGDSINYVRQNKKRNYYKKILSHKGNLSGTIPPLLRHMERLHKMITHQRSNLEVVDKDTCKWCKKKGCYQKDCVDFLKHLRKKGEDLITFVDESLY